MATGTATGALSAALLDSDPQRAPLINGLIPPAGMAVGALGASALVEVAPGPRQLIFALLLGLVLAQALAIWRMPETAVRRAGA
ncbi:hypothetical protein ABTO94_20105, partial [Acinetobacter baumannii]